MSNPARFLSRWSRLKQQAVVEAPAVVTDAQAALPEGGAEVAAAQIAPGTDLTALLREELSDAVRKQALKAIFADPHFNVMDGLDTYIDDYSISEPIPPEMLATLNQARFLFETDEAVKKPAEALAHEEGQDGTDCDNLHQCSQDVPVLPVAVLVEKEK